jgi:Amt family ammonium transporter
MLLDLARTGKATAVGAATGIVVGLVGITPAAGFVSPMSAIAIGAFAALPSYYAIQWRSTTRLDDSLDVFAAHGVGGAFGALLTGVFAAKAWGGTDGLLSDNPAQLGRQAVAVLATAAYSGVATFALLKLLGVVGPLRAGKKEEGVGMDVPQHGEEAYSSGEGAILVMDRPPERQDANPGRPLGGLGPGSTGVPPSEGRA